MPRKTSIRRRSRRVRRGRGFMDFLGKANNFLKSNKIVSSLGSALGSMGVPYASTIGNVAGSLGYGYRRRRGGALNPAGAGRRTGGMLRRAGAGRRVCRRR